MNTQNNTQSQHQEIELLLPWFVNNSLEGEELQRVEQHVRDCLSCRRELLSLRKLSAAISGKSELDIAAETSFAKLGGKMARSATQQKPVTFRQTRRFGLPSVTTLRYAVAASLLVVMVLPIGLYTLNSNNDFATLSSARPDGSNQSGELRVVFKPSTSANDIAALLEQLHGQQVGSANSIGALNIRLDNEQSPNLQQAIALLRSHPEVLLAEPVLQP